MSTTVPLQCRCGALRGAADVSPESGNRAVCYCDDCQAFARFLGQDGVVDARGGTELFQTAPAYVRLTAGAEHLQCMRLSDKGMLRWFAGCCKTPIGNTMASPRVPFVGVIHSIFEYPPVAPARDAVLGPIRGYTMGRFAIGGCPPGVPEKATAGLLLRVLGQLARSWIGRKGRPSPFFDPVTGAAVATPRVLTRAERDALRPA